MGLQNQGLCGPMKLQTGSLASDVREPEEVTSDVLGRVGEVRGGAARRAAHWMDQRRKAPSATETSDHARTWRSDCRDHQDTRVR